jgi:hypothetical protein
MQSSTWLDPTIGYGATVAELFRALPPPLLSEVLKTNSRIVLPEFEVLSDNPATR